VVLSEGSSFFIARELLLPSDSWIYPGNDLSNDQFARLQQLDQSTRCRQKGLDLLARRSHSRLELKQKLMKREFPVKEIEETLNWLQKKKFLNDRDFAETWVKNRLRKGGESRRSMIAGLKKKGINNEIIQDIIFEIPEEKEEQSLMQQWEKLWRRSSMTPEKAVKALMRKGFPYAMIRKMQEEQDD